jgi:hypothetical protein
MIVMVQSPAGRLEARKTKLTAGFRCGVICTEVFGGLKFSSSLKANTTYCTDHGVIPSRSGLFLRELEVIVTPFFQNRDAIICQRAIFVSPPREGGAMEAASFYPLAGAEHFDGVRRRVGVCSILHGLCRKLIKRTCWVARGSLWRRTTVMT